MHRKNLIEYILLHSNEWNEKQLASLKYEELVILKVELEVKINKTKRGTKK